MVNIQKVFYETEDGVELCGLLHKPKNKTDEIIIAVHGMQSNCMKKRDDIIANEVIKNNIAYFCFNNRGHDLVNIIRKNENGKLIKKLCGSSLENISDSYYDIKATINMMLNMGYNKIHLQGHSLGCTKIVYTYTKMKKQNEMEILNKIQSIILLSMVDIPSAIKFFFTDNINELIDYMEKKQKEGNGDCIISLKKDIIPMSPNTFLNYVQDNKEIDFAKYSDKTYDFTELNEITKPLFMRWGNKNELIHQDAKKLVKMLQNKLKNARKDINYIDGAGHNYKDKEIELAKEIVNFLNSNKTLLN